MCQDLTKDSPLLIYGNPEISGIFWEDQNLAEIEVGVSKCTHIRAYSDSGIVWLEIREGDFVKCRIPANQVSIYFKKPEDTK